jgi:hypothetical protein
LETFSEGLACLAMAASATHLRPHRRGQGGALDEGTSSSNLNRMRLLPLVACRRCFASSSAVDGRGSKVRLATGSPASSLSLHVTPSAGPLERGARSQRGGGGGCARALAVYEPPLKIDTHKTPFQKTAALYLYCKTAPREAPKKKTPTPTYMCRNHLKAPTHLVFFLCAFGRFYYQGQCAAVHRQCWLVALQSHGMQHAACPSWKQL